MAELVQLEKKEDELMNVGLFGCGIFERLSENDRKRVSRGECGYDECNNGDIGTG